MSLHISTSPFNVDIPAQEAMLSSNHWELDTRDGASLKFYGRLLGFASSRRAMHNHPIVTIREDSQPGENLRNTRCAACRWFEARIFVVEAQTMNVAVPNGKYVVHTLGPSVVRGEVTRSRVAWAQNGFEVVELLTIRSRDGDEPTLPAASARALSQASGLDADIREAYVNRAVA